MGFFDSIGDAFRGLTGGVDRELLATGILARGDLIALDVSSMTVEINNSLVERKCTFTLQVYVDGQAPYQATCVQRVAEVYLPQLVPGQTALAVRVNPQNPQEVAIDFNSPVPNVQVKSDGRQSAAWILANGTPADVVLVSSQPMNMTSSAGDPVHGLVLTVDKGDESYQVQVGNGVPNRALPLLYPGSKLYAKIGEGPNDVVVDWARGARA